jgi:hypothetical protein
MLADRPHGRRLTAAEQMRLDQLERQLSEDDPQLAEVLSSGPGAATGPGRWLSWSRVLLAGAAAAAVFLVLLAALVGGLGGAVAVVVTLITASTGWYLLRRRSRS